MSPHNAHVVVTPGNAVSFSGAYLKLYQKFMIEIKLLWKQPCSLSEAILQSCSYRCSENMPQIYRRTPMPKWDANKVAKQLYWNLTPAWLFSCKFSAYFLYFLNTFLQEHLWRTVSVLVRGILNIFCCTYGIFCFLWK